MFQMKERVEMAPSHLWPATPVAQFVLECCQSYATWNRWNRLNAQQYAGVAERSYAEIDPAA
ncbi:MAG: hypothetical protein ABGY95_07290 [Rubritalea sp.]|uniref:hypothetical protein n=1 Tax=Rubritalea sp. TaxID=2109375 RepID=UPI0032425F79